MAWNLSLALHLAVRSLAHHRMIAVATILGVALGVCVVAAILIVDVNTARVEPPPLSRTIISPANQADADSPEQVSPAIVTRIRFERPGREPETGSKGLLPTQEGAARRGITPRAPASPRRGEEDYQTMRLAVRLASLFSFFVGAVIVFYTMRFSVFSRAREFSLTLCIGEFRHNVSASLVIEAFLLGGSGALLGILLSLPLAAGLLAMGLSTTGRAPDAEFTLPTNELIILGVIGLSIALLGVLSPVCEIYRLNIARVLQPRFLSSERLQFMQHTRGFGWLIPPLLAGTWLALRPFLQSWISVTIFFLIEISVVLILASAALWWIKPLLQGMVDLAGKMLRTLLPLETTLAARRMSLSSHTMVFPVAAVMLVFSLLTALHAVTRTLQDEVGDWSREAMRPYSYYRMPQFSPVDEESLQQLQHDYRMVLFRLSAKSEGEFPLRLIRRTDINPWLELQGRHPLLPGTVMLSRTLAARFDLRTDDFVIFYGPSGEHRFRIIDVADDIGFYAEDGQYIDLKSYALFSDGNPVFAGNLEKTLGDYIKARPAGNGRDRLERWQENALQKHYRFMKSGHSVGSWQLNEINRDFLIFDFVLIMTIILAAVGVTNTLLIQVHSRQREFSVLRTIGMDRQQVMRMLVLEGVIIAMVSALLALVVGNILGAVSVSFLDRFSLFDYRFVFSPGDTAWITILALITCSIAALYPAVSAARISSAESLHYE